MIASDAAETRVADRVPSFPFFGWYLRAFDGLG